LVWERTIRFRMSYKKIQSTGETRNKYKILVGKPKDKYNLRASSGLDYLVV
jgi:hypothetical protein